MKRLICWVLGMPFVLTALTPLAAQDYSPPPANLPSPEALKEIARKTTRLEEKIAGLRKQIPPVPDAVLADAEVYLRAVQAIVKHNEFFAKDSTAWTLEALDRGLWRAQYIAGAETPWLDASGQTVARGYRSQVDNSVQPFAVTYPIGFGKDRMRRWRVDVVLHGRDTSLTEVKFLHANNGERAVPKDQDFVQITIFGRGNNAYRWSGEADVFEAIRAYIDTEKMANRLQFSALDRVVLRGFSMGGAGTWHIGLHYPDQWCCIGPGAGFTTTHGYVANLPDPLPPYQEPCLRIYDAVDYALNAFDVPVVAYSGANDPQKKAADNIEAILKKADVPMDHLVAPGLAHQFPPAWFKKANELYSKYAERGRPRYPEAVSFVTYTLKYPKCDWVSLLGLEKHYDKALVQAIHSVAGYNLRTKNVHALRITLPDLAAQAQDIAIDEQKLVARPQPADDGGLAIFLQRRAGKWMPVLPQRLATQQAQHPRKAKDLQGPIDDAFAAPFLCVRGTGKGWHETTHKATAARLQQFGQVWSKYWRGQLPVKDDTDVTAEDIATRHLVLFGDPASNSLIAQVLDGLPLAWTKDEIRFAGQKVEADQHIPVLIYPNPLNTQRYVVLNSGHTIPAADYTKTNALLFPRLGDYALLRIAPTAEDAGATEVVTAGLFDDSWSIPTPALTPRKQERGAAVPPTGLAPVEARFVTRPWERERFAPTGLVPVERGSRVENLASTGTSPVGGRPGVPYPLVTNLVSTGASPVGDDTGIIPTGAKVEKLWSEGEFTEGPAYGPDGCVYFTDIGNRIMKFDPRTSKTSEYRKPSGRANGLDFDPQGRLVACEGANTGGNRRVTITEKDGKIRVLADRYKGKRFNSPNDVTIDTRGRVYFTDPRYVGEEPLELDKESVYRIDLDGTVTRIISDVTKPNGVVLSPDMKTLYLAESHPKGDRLLLSYPLNADGSVGAKKVLYDFKNDRGIDGMCVDVKGNIYGAAGQGKTGGVSIFTPAGKKLGFIATPETPSNCVFGDADHKTLYITAGRSLYRIRLNTEGFAVYWPK